MSQEHERKTIRLSAIIIIVGRCVSIGFIKLYEIAAVYEVICIHLLASVDHLLSIKMSGCNDVDIRNIRLVNYSIAERRTGGRESRSVYGKNINSKRMLITYFKYSSRQARSPELVARTIIIDTSLKHRRMVFGIKRSMSCFMVFVYLSQPKNCILFTSAYSVYFHSEFFLLNCDKNC